MIEKKLVTCYGRTREQVVPKIGLKVSYWNVMYTITDISDIINKQGFPNEFKMRNLNDGIEWVVKFNPSKRSDCYNFDSLSGDNACNGWFE